MLNAKLFLMLLMTPAMAMATSLAPYFNFDGILTDSSGTAVTTANTPVKFRVMDPTGTCLLYEETQNVSPGADGSISVQIGSEIGNGKRTGGFVSYTWAKIFSNMGSFPANTGCSSGWTPAPNDSRVLQVVVNSTTLSPNYALAAVPMATVAETLNGKQASDFLQFNMTAPVQLNQTNLESVFSGSNYTNLLSVLAGNVMQTNPTAPVSFNNQKITNVAAPVAPTDAVNKSYADTAMGGKSLDFTGVNGTAGNGHTIIWDQANNRWTTGPATATDNTKLPLVGGYLTGFLDMGSNPIQAVGHITMSSQKALTIGKFDSTQEAVFVPTLNASNAGATWYNSSTQKLRIYNGSTAVDVGGGGSGDFKADGSVPMTNSLIGWGAGSAASPAYTFSGASNTGMFYASPGALGFSTSNTEQMRIDSAGNIGVNNPSPSARLNVRDNSDNQLRLESMGSSETTTAIWTSTGKDMAIQLGGPTSGMPNMFSIKDQSMGQYRMVIDGTGRFVLNGTATTPGAILDVNGAGTAMSSILLPRDTTANQPSPVNGMIRYNTSTNMFEGVQNGTWAPFASAIMNAPMAFQPGNNAAPSITFNGDQNTGFYNPLPDVVAIATNGSERFRVDNNGNVGINNNNPQSPLHVGGSSGSTVTQAQFDGPIVVRTNASGTTFPALSLMNMNPSANSASSVNFAATNTSSGQATAARVSGLFTSNTAGSEQGALTFSVQNAGIFEAMRLDSQGRMGVGTAVPSMKVDVVTNDATTYADSGGGSLPAAATKHLRIANSYNAALNIGSFVVFDTYNAAATPQPAYIGAVSAPGYTPSIVLGSRAGASTYSERMRIDGPTGNVGIGTAAPLSTLSLYTNTSPNVETSWQGSGMSMSGLSVGVSRNPSSMGMSEPANTAYVRNSENTPLVLMTNDAPRVFIDGGGNVGIGTITPAYKMDVWGSLRSMMLKVGTVITGGTDISSMAMCSGTNGSSLIVSSTAGTSFTFTCTGVSMGMAVSCSPNALPGTSNISWSSMVDSANTIRIQVTNTSTSATAFNGGTAWKCIVAN